MSLFYTDGRQCTKLISEEKRYQLWKVNQAQRPFFLQIQLWAYITWNRSVVIGIRRPDPSSDRRMIYVIAPPPVANLFNWARICYIILAQNCINAVLVHLWLSDVGMHWNISFSFSFYIGGNNERTQQLKFVWSMINWKQNYSLIHFKVHILGCCYTWIKYTILNAKQQLRVPRVLGLYKRMFRNAVGVAL